MQLDELLLVRNLICCCSMNLFLLVVVRAASCAEMLTWFLKFVLGVVVVVRAAAPCQGAVHEDSLNGCRKYRVRNNAI